MLNVKVNALSITVEEDCVQTLKYPENLKEHTDHKIRQEESGGAL